MKLFSRCKSLFYHTVIAAFLTSTILPVSAGTLLPPGEVTFFDNNGLPLSSGCVFFYTPGTTNTKATYQNSAQTIANTNPVQLDAAGRAIIYGTGTYRQIVTAVGSGGTCSPAGAQIWDQLTASTDSSVTIYAGASAGTPNAITITAAAFTGTDGQVINYISTNTNTGAATLNVSSFGNVQIVRDSSTGPGALTGGELVATNAVSVIYDATAGVFHILSPITWPQASGVPVGAIIPTAGFTAPSGYAFSYGQAVSRTSFAVLFAAYTSQQTASLSSGNPIITGLTDTTQFGRGQAIEAVGIPAGATIQSCTSTACTLSANATATRSGTVTVFAYGNGDGSTTFNLPDTRGRSLIARDNLGGVAGNVDQVTTTMTTTSGSPSATVASAANLSIGMTVSGNANIVPGTTISAISGTTITLSVNASGTQSNVSTRLSIFPDAQALGIAGGSQNHAQTVAEMPTHNHGITDPGHNHTNLLFNGSGGTLGVAGGNGGSLGTNIGSSQSFTGITINNTGGGIALPTMQPSLVINYAVKLTP